MHEGGIKPLQDHSLPLASAIADPWFEKSNPASHFCRGNCFPKFNVRYVASASPLSRFNTIP
jgi:hypothetical protein